MWVLFSAFREGLAFRDELQQAGGNVTAVDVRETEEVAQALMSLKMDQNMYK